MLNTFEFLPPKIYQNLQNFAVIFIAGAVCFYSSGSNISAASADSSEITDIYGLDLWEMREITVISKKLERIDEAPGIVTVVTSDDIHRFGARNLKDILDRLPNFLIVGSSLFPAGASILRGMNPGPPDNTILFLLNGMPIRDTGTGGSNIDLYLMLPVGHIDRIEVIRGPGAVLYGPNAFAGIINIKTKRLNTLDDTTAATSVGSFKRRQLAISCGIESGDGWLTGGFTTLRDSGDTFSRVAEPANQLNKMPEGDFRTEHSGYGLYLTGEYRNLSIQGIFTNVDHAAESDPSMPRDTDRQQLNLVYRIGSKSAWNSTIAYSPSRLRHESPEIPLEAKPDDIRSVGHLIEFTTTGNITDNLGVVLGSAYETTQTHFINGDTDNTWWSEIYGHVDYRFSPRLKFVGGLQLNKIEDLDADFSPRLGGIFNFNRKWGAKLLYGHAFRPPRTLQNQANRGATPPVPLIDPEIAKTFDAQIFFQGIRLRTAVTYFHTKQTDLQVAVFPPFAVPFFENRGEINYDGIEWEFEYNVNDCIRLTGNLTYQMNEAGDGTSDISRSPNWMAKTGISYSSANGWDVSLFNIFVSEAIPIEDIDRSQTTAGPSSDSFNLLTANVNANLGALFDKPSLAKIDLSIYADNLLDDDIRFPDATVISNYPIHNGRGVYATLRISF